jgi:hypothetical protein
MEDIAKGLKIAGAIGGAAVKAAKTIQDTLQTAQGTQSTSATPSSSQSSNQQAQKNPVTPNSPASVPYQAAPQSPPPKVQPTNSVHTEQSTETLFCDQCGAPVRPGKHFCNQCGAKLP